jgi:uncharacterized protein
MFKSKFIKLLSAVILILFPFSLAAFGAEKQSEPAFNVIAFFTAKNDAAHISFVHEANKWFAATALKYNFKYDSTNDWNNMNDEFLSHYQVVVFPDTRPDSVCQRDAFKRYMDKGGALLCFHFAAFALTPSAFPQNWDWYHRDLLGAGQYVGNTWAPTSAILSVENRKHPATANLPETFVASPNEWYKWELDLTKNPDIKILVSINPKSFPLGTGPKQHEIWHEGYYPVVWTNTKYRMLYINMGHNIVDYENKTLKDLSHTFNNKDQDQLVIDGLLWLGGKKK